MGYQDRDETAGGRRPKPSGNREQGPRTPLQWRTERAFQSGRVVLVLQSAELDRGGKRFSFRIGKESRENPDKPFPFLDPRDIIALREVVAAMEAHILELRSAGPED